MRKDPIAGKKIILGVTGCIAAYKSALIIRELIKRNADVKVVMTPAAAEFITPLTLATLSGNPVTLNTFPQNQKEETNLSTWHIDLALWADIAMVAPCTVNTIAKIANGFADNALTTLVAALRTPLIIAPAADVDMYKNKIVQQNIKKLEDAGYYLLPAEEGELASGLTGEGRLPTVDKIIDTVELVLSGYKKDFTGKKILVSAGPTFEDIDPVRFLGNRSSGKMGYAIAKAAFLRGAEVTLISGPSSLNIYPEIDFIKVRSAKEMQTLIKKHLQKNDALIMAAAVADFKPAKKYSSKIKRSSAAKEIKLVENEDILANLKPNGKKRIGFALETDNELKNAKAKLKNKNLDMIVLNSLKEKGSGFEVDTNKITIIKKSGKAVNLPLQSKFQAANKILDEIVNLF